MNLERLNHLKNSGGCLKELDHLYESWYNKFYLIVAPL